MSETTLPTLTDLPPRALARLSELARGTVLLKEIRHILASESIHLETDLCLAMAREVRAAYRAEQAEAARKAEARKKLSAAGKHVYGDPMNRSVRRKAGPGRHV